MCWNPDISINTFLLGALTLCFIYYSNTYTKYHTPIFDNRWFYVFTFLVILMQLVEYFIWKNIDIKRTNNFYSLIGWIILILQPAALIMMVKEKDIRNNLLFYYTLFVIFFNIVKINSKNTITTVSQNGHLLWNFVIFSGYEYIYMVIYMFFYLFSAYLINLHLFLFLITFFTASFIINFKDKTWGSMWCWSSNFVWIYFIIRITIYLPFLEYNKLC